MLFLVGATISLFITLAAAQDYGGAPASPTTTAAAAVPTAPADTPGHVNVNVAMGGFTFSPANVTAANGTSVTFWFPNTGIDHSVTQSSFANPCTYLTASANNSAGFDSGLTNSKQFTIVITDAQPLALFGCTKLTFSQVQHCGMGMVGSINAPASGNTFAAFQAAAMKIGTSEVTEPDSGAVTGGFNAVASVGPTATGSSSPSSGMRLSANAGAVLLGVAMLAVYAC
ncbi:hypothetical protein B0H10DRAFT_1786371 [Mycena sp. CBHHK59/15]|nr:hypothetical protein B0H10DRAFT_1786371 [Mycena sp. CBHHK59/15]